MRRSLLATPIALVWPAATAGAQMAGGQDRTMMGNGQGWGMMQGWGLVGTIVVVVLIVLLAVNLMKKK